MIKFGVSFMYTCYFKDSGESTSTAMESIKLIHADSYEEVKKIASIIGFKNEHTYKNMDGIDVSWILSGLKIYEISDSSEISTEIFSRFIDEKCETMLLADYDEVFLKKSIERTKEDQ